MSERKSWDVQPRRPTGAPKRMQATPVRASVDAVRQTKKPASPGRPTRPVRPRAARASGGRLRDRRRRARKAGLIALVLLLILLAAVTLYLVWLPHLRIQSVTAEGPNAEEAASLARAQLSGTYAFILPRNSVFFIPKDQIREAVRAEYPAIAALSIKRTSFTSIALTGTPRAKAFIWCGPTAGADNPGGACFEADAEGLVYKPANVSTSTVVLSTGAGTPTTAGDLRIYAPLDRELGEGISPVGARIINHSAIPDALRFVKAIRELGVPVSALVLRGDEADLLLGSPTRITYVLGQEEMAAQLAASVIPTLNLTDGTVEYLDLRFNGKAYVKRYGESAP